MLKCEMSRLERKANVSAVGTTDDVLTELAALVSEITRTLLNPSEDDAEIIRHKQIIIGSLIGGVEYGTVKYRKDLEAKQDGSSTS